MNIHVARPPHFRTGFTHTCCQGQTGSLTVRPDTARWEGGASRDLYHISSTKGLIAKVIIRWCGASKWSILNLEIGALSRWGT